MKNAAVCFSVKDKQLYILKPDEIHLPKCYQIFNWKKRTNPRVDNRNTYYIQ